MHYQPSPDLPPWSARGQREKDWMRDWVCDQLKTVIGPPTIDEANPGSLDATEFALFKSAKALAEARSGDVSALRRLHPEFSDHIQPKKLKRGEKHPTLPNIRMVLVPLVRMIWRTYYRDDKRYPEGRWKRVKYDGYSAEEIASYFLRHHVRTKHGRREK